VTQYVVTVPAANLAWKADDVLQVLVTVFDPDVEADIRLNVGDTWLPVEMAGGTVRRENA
jgi:hypothetical protein